MEVYSNFLSNGNCSLQNCSPDTIDGNAGRPKEKEKGTQEICGASSGRGLNQCPCVSCLRQEVCGSSSGRGVNQYTCVSCLRQEVNCVRFRECKQKDGIRDGIE